ncbi:hypothetical protein ACFL3J_02015 [Candidatus Omnitrophota bacterium]
MQEIVKYKCNGCGEISEITYTPPNEMPKENVKISGGLKCKKCGSDALTELSRRPK